MLTTAQQVGGSLGIALLNTLFASAVADRMATDPLAGTGAAMVHGYHVAFVWAAVFLGVALVLAVALISARKSDLPAPEMALAV